MMLTLRLTQSFFFPPPRHWVRHSVNGQPFVSRGVLLAGSMDLPAKAEAQGFTHHNGHCGCPFCLNPGLNVSTASKKKKSHVHVYSSESSYSDRTVWETVKHATQARPGNPVCFGPSFFFFPIEGNSPPPSFSSFLHRSAVFASLLSCSFLLSLTWSGACRLILCTVSVLGLPRS